jgi:hypothetical protein
MTLHDTQPETEPASARRTLTDRAVLAGERLLEAGTTVGNAYADYCEEAVVGMAGFRKRIADARPAEWPKLVQGQALNGSSPVGKPLLDAANAASRVTEQLVASSKRLGVSYLEAYEQAVLGAVDRRERAATASGSRWLSSIGSMRAGIARDVAKSYGEHARRVLA